MRAAAFALQPLSESMILEEPTSSLDAHAEHVPFERYAESAALCPLQAAAYA